jgi:E3 ubiquitin-protein ligase RNF14
MFDKESFECGICLDRKMGYTCYRYEHSKHIFCISCLQECFNCAIVAGSVDEVQCPSVDCGVEKQDASSRRVKKVRLISPEELLRIPIERAAVQRFVDMKRKKMLESDPSTIWCPGKWCQSAAINKKYPKPTVPLEEMDESYDIEEATSTPVPDDSNDEATKDKKILDDRLRTCENDKCDYSFCKLCRKVWHGPIFDCHARKDIPEELRQLDAKEQASEKYINQYSVPLFQMPAARSEIGGVQPHALQALWSALLLPVW